MLSIDRIPFETYRERFFENLLLTILFFFCGTKTSLVKSYLNVFYEPKPFYVFFLSSEGLLSVWIKRWAPKSIVWTEAFSLNLVKVFCWSFGDLTFWRCKMNRTPSKRLDQRPLIDRRPIQWLPWTACLLTRVFFLGWKPFGTKFLWTNFFLDEDLFSLFD